MRAAVFALSAAVVIAAVVVSLMPRYELRTIGGGKAYRMDRWTGQLELVTLTRPTVSTYSATVQPVTP
jgi:hypothetical protein